MANGGLIWSDRCQSSQNLRIDNNCMETHIRPVALRRANLDLPRFRGQFLVFALGLWSYLLNLTPQGSLTPQAAEAPAFGFALNAGVRARS